MSTIALRAALVREIERAMKRVEKEEVFFPDGWGIGYRDGRLDAYAHILTLIKDEDL